MLIIDTHCHVGLHKYEPVECLLFHMQRSQVAHAVLIQYAGNTDNRYLVDCLRSNHDRFRATMIVEPHDDGHRMRYWAAQGITGIRLTADSRAEAADPLAQWRTAAEMNLVVSAPCSPDSLLGDRFTEVVRTFPELSIVIEHIGGIGRNVQPPYDAFRRILRLAEYPNLTIKLPGFGEFCELPHPFAHIPPLAEMTIEAFGPQRVMWGSDYPPVSSREGYQNALSFPMAYLSSLSEDERGWIFGRTALSIWRFSA